jgi:hypothetical protein
LNTPEALPEIDMQVTPNPTSDEVRLTFNLTAAGPVNIILYNLSGIMLSNTEKQYDSFGIQSETIPLNNLHLTQGIYYLRVVSNGMQGVKKIIKQ